ncbi:MAG: hypothetical protein Tsb0020_12550 [Haliangiales bacterium]
MVALGPATATSAYGFTSDDAPATAPTLETAYGAPARQQPDVGWNRAPAASRASWQAFAAAIGPGWQVMWDRDTGVPNRIFGPGIEAPGSVASADAAVAAARAILAKHIDLLAPGSQPRDFVVVSNHLGDGMRTVGMQQHYQGTPVLTGQLSFRFKNDRLFVIASEALPHVATPPTAYSMSAQTAATAATQWVSADAGQAWTSAVDGPYILPIISHREVRYHTVMRSTVEARAPLARYQVYVDVASAAPVAREQVLHFADGRVLYNAPSRYPDGERLEYPASFTEILIDGEAVESDSDGLVSWAGDAPVKVETQLIGPLVHVVNEDDPDNASVAEFTLSPGGEVVWDERDDELLDAQLSTYAHSLVVKEYVRQFAPDLLYLDDQLLARVNINNTCNAFSDGTTINFFRGSDDCANTARLADVVYHEFGHALHWQSLIPGVGRFDGGFSEGLSDYLAATITNDPAMGVGFFRSPEPLRHIDPDDFEHRWPRDVQRVHYTGLIFAGAMWDLRKALIARHGAEEGVKTADRLFYAAVQRASSIPATYAEVLAADDDDGDLSNGTPNECLINASFGALHGLRDIVAWHEPVGAQAVADEGHQLSFRVSGFHDRCAGDRPVSVSVNWQVNEAAQADLATLSGEEAAILESQDGDDRTYSATIPSLPGGTKVRYQIVLETADSGVWTFPNNMGEESYELYVGELLELYCTDFESDPFSADGGWTHGLSNGAGGAGADDWEWGQPVGKAGDPDAAYSGTGMIGNDLGRDGYDGSYQALKINYVESPAVEVGDYSDVRVQFRRWLTVEDSTWDYASVYANGRLAWRNRGTNAGNRHHTDSNWVFHDVPVGRAVKDGEVKVRFEIDSDGGLEFGGWNIDDFCVVARPGAFCGNGVLEGGEQCDLGDGNDDSAADGCRTNCSQNFCGDGVVDSYEECDDGNNVDDDGCTATCFFPYVESSGCSIEVGRAAAVTAGAGTGGSAAGSLASLGLALFGLWAWRRRRRA